MTSTARKTPADHSATSRDAQRLRADLVCRLNIRRRNVLAHGLNSIIRRSPLFFSSLPGIDNYARAAHYAALQRCSRGFFVVFVDSLAAGLRHFIVALCGQHRCPASLAGRHYRWHRDRCYPVALPPSPFFCANLFHATPATQLLFLFRWMRYTCRALRSLRRRAHVWTTCCRFVAVGDWGMRMAVYVLRASWLTTRDYV